MSEDAVPAWTKDSVLLRVGDFSPVGTLSPEWALDGATGHGVRVAIVDSGIDADHPQLGDCVDRQGSVDVVVGANGEVDIVQGPHDDVYGHGTACAGIIHALAPEAAITSVRVLGPGLKGKAQSFLAGLQWAVDNEFDVVNLSLGASHRDWALAFHDLCDRAYFSNSFVVTAANNVRRLSFPSLYSAVASVACNTSDDPLRFHYNPEPPTEFLARGIDIEVPWLDKSTTVTTGNSFAAPHIAAFAALIRSKHPGLQPFLVKAALWACAANVRDRQAPVEQATGTAWGSSVVLRRRTFATQSVASQLVEEQAVTTGGTESTSGADTHPDSPREGEGLDDAASERAPDRRMSEAQKLLATIELTGTIAHGAWGSVYAGTNGTLEVAVRVVDQALGTDPALVRRFVASVRTAAGLSSPHVVPVYEVIESDEQVLVIMPRCPSNLAAEAPNLSLADICVAGLGLLAGLDASHRAGVLHGDLNAQNSLIDAKRRVVTSDVGLAAPLQTTRATARLRPESWNSLAPEQLLGEALGTYTDTYAVAVVLYELMAGRSVHPVAESFAGVHARTKARTAVAPLASVSDVNAGLCAVIDRALAFDPVDRHASAATMFQALAGAAFDAFGRDFIERSRFVLEV